MKQARQSFALRIRIIAGLILSIALVLTLFSMPDIASGMTHMSMAAAVCLGGINITSKNLVELKEMRGEKFTELESLVNLCDTEKRGLTDIETSKRNDLALALRELDAEIDVKEQIEKRQKDIVKNQFKKENGNPEQREVASYSYVKAIREMVNQMTGGGSGLTGIEKEMHVEAVREFNAMGKTVSGLGVPGIILKRDLTATGTTTITGDQGGLSIQTTKVGFVDALRAKMVLADLGAQFLTGLTGNVSIPKKSAVSVAGWANGENVAAVVSQPLFGSIEMTPKRLTTFVNISKQLLGQSSLDVESLVLDDLQTAVRLALEAAAINGSGTLGVPKGILNTVGIGAVVGGTNGLIPTYQNLIDLESAVAVANADMGALAYLTNPKVRGKLKSTPKVAGQPVFLWDGSDFPINGYKTSVTSQVPFALTKGTSAGVCSAIIFGNFAELLIGQWAGLDMVIDPYTLAVNNEVKITINSLWDIAVRHPESFAAMVDALTA